MDNKWKNVFNILFLAVFLFSTIQNSLFAESSSSEDRFNKEFLIDFKKDFVEVLSSPKDWRRKDFLYFSAFAGGGLILYVFDEDIQQWIKDLKNSSSEDFFNALTHFGDGYILAGLITALYTYGELSRSNNLRRTALLSLESWVTTGIIVAGLKFFLGRARPKTGESSHNFHLFSLRSSYTSFPSGHASSAFAVATVIADQSKKAYIDVLAYSLATLVAISRIHKNEHWASDVFVGSSFGYFVAKKILALNRNRDSNKLQIDLHLSHQKTAFSLSISF